MFLLSIFLGLTLFFAMAAVGFRAQQRFALSARLDICATRVASHKLRLLTKLQEANESLKVLRLIVYASRGMKILLPGTGIFSKIGEQAALKAMRVIVVLQRTAIQAAAVKEFLLRSCSQTAFSDSLAFCSFQALLPSQFVREKSAFPDIPGPLEWSIRTQSIRCMGISFSGPSTLLEIHAPSGLAKPNFSYVYKE